MTRYVRWKPPPNAAALRMKRLDLYLDVMRRARRYRERNGMQPDVTSLLSQF